MLCLRHPLRQSFGRDRGLQGDQRDLVAKRIV
jgi:hypothetical protein